MKTKILLLAALAALPACAEDDFGLWTNVSIQKSLTSKLTLNGDFELRANDKVGDVSRYSVAAGLTYKPLKYLHLGATYNFIRDHSLSSYKEHFKEDDDGELDLEDGLPVLDGYNFYDSYWRNKHRINLEATGKVSFGRFTLSLRERYQYTHAAEVDVDRDQYRLLPENFPPSAWTGGELTEINGRYAYLDDSDVKTKNGKDSQILRSRLKVEYNINHCPLNPYLSYEFNNDLTEKLHLDKTRLIVGTELKISKQHRLDFAYLFQDYHGRDNLHAISVGYKFKF